MYLEPIDQTGKFGITSLGTTEEAITYQKIRAQEWASYDDSEF